MLELSLGKEQKDAHVASSRTSRVHWKPTHPFDTTTPVISLSCSVLFIPSA